MIAAKSLGEDNGYCFQPEPGGQIPLPETGSSKWARLRKAKELVPELQRFQLCNDATRRGVMNQVGVSIYTKGDSAYFQGVIQCGSVWLCPVCAQRIAEQRREELQEAVNNAIRQGFGIALVTLTFPHGVGDVLAEILPKHALAQRYFKSGRAAAAIRKSLGYKGEIKTLEVTHGNNGWHPHTHSIWVTEKQLSAEEAEALETELYQMWRAACLRAGLPEPSREHGVDVRAARHDVADYVGKWGFAGELALGSRKRGKLGSRTPWQLLADAAEGDKRAGWLWREFALAFFGKRQLFWSRQKIDGEWVSIRNVLKLAPELTDQQVLELDHERAIQVAFIDWDTWWVVRRAQAQEHVLHYAVHDLRELFIYLNHLRSTVPLLDGSKLGPREDWIT